MKISNIKTTKLNQFLFAILFALSTVLPSFSWATIAEDNIVRDALSKMGPSSSIEESQSTQNGIIIYTVKVRNCQSDGVTCKYSEKSSQFRTTQATLPMDGHILLVEAVDRVGGDYPRINFKTGYGISSDGTLENMDPTSFHILEMNPSSSSFQAIAEVAPSIAIGLIDGYKNIQNSLELGARLQKAYQNVLEKTRTANDNFLTQAQAMQEASLLNSGIVNFVVAERLSQTSIGKNRTKDYDDYLQASQDPLSFREYELTPKVQSQFYQEASKALSARQLHKITKVGEVLLHQRDGKQTAQATKYLQKVFKDGVLRTQALGGKKESLLDRTRFSTQAHSPGGEVVRHLANQAQISWLETQGLETLPPANVLAYTAGLATLRAADENFAQGNTENGYKYAQVSGSLLDLSRGIVRGSLNSFISSVQGIPLLAQTGMRFGNLLMSNPGQAAAEFGEFVGNIPGIAEAMAMHYVKMATQLAQGDAYKRGEILGEIGAEILVNVLTDGVISGVKKAATVSGIIKKTGKITEIVSQAANESFKLPKKVADVFTGNGAKALVKIEAASPASAAEYLSASRALVESGEAQAAHYLSKVAQSDSKYLLEPGVPKEIAEKYLDLQKKMSDVTLTRFDDIVSRGVPKEVYLPSGIQKNTAEDVFQWHAGMRGADNRYSLGGPEGLEAMYTVVGNDKSLEVLIASETKSSVSKLVFNTQNIKLERVLDLTDPKVQIHLGVKKSDITLESEVVKSYRETHILGDIANTNQLDGLLVPSVFGKVSNLVIFKGK